MIRALVVYCHPREASFTAAVRDRVRARLAAAGADVRVTDLYARTFDPRLSAAEHAGYLDAPANRATVEADVADLLWADTLIFVYPTWWYGPPAMLKGWLDRVLVPGVAFHMPETEKGEIAPGLTGIQRIGVFTSGGASRWLTRVVGAPGKKMLLRGVRMICAPRVRTVFAAHYRMDVSTAESRARHLNEVARRTDRLIGAAGAQTRALAEAKRNEETAE